MQEYRGLRKGENRMRKRKGAAALLLAAVMLASVSVPAAAAGSDAGDRGSQETGAGAAGQTTARTVEIRVAEGSVHTYEVYQIFTGDVSKETDEQGKERSRLANVIWGKNGTGTEGGSVDASVMEELEKSGAEAASDSEKLAVIEKYAELEKGHAYGTVTAGKPLSDVPAGYYLIKDADGSLEADNIIGEAYTAYLVQILGSDLEIKPKSAVPTVDKQVLDETDNGDPEEGAVDGWGETADHGINDPFQFRLTAALPNDPGLDAYDHYQITFHDEMFEGITFVQIDSVSVNGTAIDVSEYTETASSATEKAGLSWSLTVTDLKRHVKDLKGASVEVVYTAFLNEKAEVNGPEVGAYSWNSNKVMLTYSNNPGWDGTGTPDTGRTAEDTAWVYTYGVDNRKVEVSGTIMESGAEVPNRVPLEGAGFRLYQADGEQEIPLLYSEDREAYYPKAAEDPAEGVEMFSNADGNFNIIGLDIGTYVLKETTTPDGYNTCDPIIFTLTSSHRELEDGTEASADIRLEMEQGDAEKKEDISSIEVVNMRGSLLPGTGGIGTTIFYAAGGCLVVVGGGLLILRRRMKKAK